MEEERRLSRKYRGDVRIREVSSQRDALNARPSGSLLTWEQAVRVLDRHKWTLLTVICGMSLAITGLAFMMRDVYQPTARLEIDPLGGGIKTLHEIEATNSEGDQDYLDTQVQILQSDGLAMRVIRALHLDQGADFTSGKDSAHQADRNVTLESVANGSRREAGFFQEQLELAEPTPAEASALRAFHSKLWVNPIRGSRLVELSFASHDPRTAQAVTNALVTQFIDQNYKNRYVTTMEASEWLSAQLNDLRQKVSESNQRVADYQKKYGLLESDDRDLPLSQLMADVSHQLSDAQADRIQAEAYVRMIDLGQPESVPALRDDVVYQNMLTRYAEVRAQLAQAQTIYGEESTNVKKLQNEANEIAAQLEAERNRIINRLRTGFAAARSREQMMTESRERLRGQMGDTSSHLVEYRTLKNEATANADLYNTLQARLKEAGIYAGLRSGNIRIVDMAPRLYRATSPHRRVIIVAGFLFSSLLALGFVFVRESFENTVRIPDDIEEWLRLPSLAILPTIEGDAAGPEKLLPESNGISMLKGRPAADHSFPKMFWFRSQTAEGEAIRSLRSALTVFPSEKAPHVILISSASGGEGKTTIAINLASVLAQQGSTCLVEADLRRPIMEDVLRLSPRFGLGEVLEGKATLSEALCPIASVPGLTVLPVKSLPDNPADLLSSQPMKTAVNKLRDSFDFVVIDSPPTIPFSDSQSLARLADAVILVSRYGRTTRRAITRGVELLDDSNARLIGVVLNDMDLSSPDYRYFSYGYSWNGGDRRYPYTKSKASWPASPDDPGTGPAKSKGAHA